MVGWLPVVGTLSGAAIGFLGSSLTTWFNNREIKSRNEDDRTRNRLESIYELLVEIQIDYISLMGNVIAYAHGGEKILVNRNEKISPLVKLEMLVSLYFPEFHEKWKSLEKTKNLFGKELASLMLISTQNLQLKERQELAAKFVRLQLKVDKSIMEFQKAIASDIKP